MISEINRLSLAGVLDKYEEQVRDALRERLQGYLRKELAQVLLPEKSDELGRDSDIVEELLLAVTQTKN